MGRLEAWIDGWRGPLLAAVIAVVAGLPGLIALPTLDRNEAHFVQATAQMLESGDFIAIRFQDRLRAGGAPGSHWLQAATVATLADAESREIWLYRLWSLAGAALAAAACVWGGQALFGKAPAFVAGAALGSSLVLSTAAGLATADALFAGACALMVAGFARVRLSVGEGLSPRRRDRVWLWAGLIGGVLLKGPLLLGLALLSAAALFGADRGAPWFKKVGWGWGMLALLALAGPWVVAVTIATDGAVWTPVPPPEAVGEWPGWQTLIAPLFFFPATALLPIGLAHAWTHRKSSHVRVALAWLIPGWILFELMPGKHVFATLPLYLSLAWLGAAGLFAQDAWVIARRVGAALSLLTGLVFAGGSIWLAGRFGQASDLVLGLVGGVLFLSAGAVAAIALKGPNVGRLVLALVLAIAANGWLTAALLPRLKPLWTTREILAVLDRKGLDPREGLAVGPVTAAGFDEPSLVFALGARTETGDGALAARAIEEGRPAIVEDSEKAAFEAALNAHNLRADVVAELRTYDYAQRRDLLLRLYRRPKQVPVP